MWFFQEDNWVTKNGISPLPSEEENCKPVDVTEEDVKKSIQSVPKLDTLVSNAKISSVISIIKNLFSKIYPNI